MRIGDWGLRSASAEDFLFPLSFVSGDNSQSAIRCPQSEMAGYLALILHAHLPFVRHPEHEHFLEEEWLFEAITETYIPLLQMMQRLLRDRVPFKVTMSFTPTLCAMLRDELLRERYLQHLDLLLDLSAREIERNRQDPALLRLAQFYLQLFSETRRFFVDEWKCDLLAAFRQIRDAGALEIMASAATHGLLPLIYQQSPAAARAQIFVGRDEYVDVFNEPPKGFWLPECAYRPGLEWILQEANLRWFVLDAHGLMHATPRPQRAVYAPCYTPAGPAALARDRGSSRQVWSAHGGYPGDPAYREFYRDIGFDLPMDHLGPVARDMRKFAGVKYHRITFSRNDVVRYTNLVHPTSIRLSLFLSMQSYSGTGGLKVRISSSFSFARVPSTSKIFDLRRRANSLLPIPRNKAFNRRLPPGEKRDTSQYGSIRATPGSIRIFTALRTA